ncbi:MAG TPA: sulfatase [Planctomycetaceae bacterium]|nr:sulfatase [Planctomycetaceae bacterium]
MRQSLCVTILILTASSATCAAERPNIVFCFADDWGRYASAYAAVDGKPSPNEIVRTPNIDRVAREGVLFRHAFVNAPSCTPCRSSLLSGRYFFNTGRGAILVGAQWDSAIPSWPLLLKDAGYHIGETYKVWSPGTPNDAPFGAGQFAYEKAGGQFNNFSENVTKLVADGVAIDAAKSRMYANVRENFAAFLNDRKEGQPFCYWFGPTNVHRTWVKGSGKALWNIEPESLNGKLPAFLPNVPEVREDFADYLGEVQAWDAGVGVILRQLEAAEELDKTIVVISGDHGAPGFPGGKCNLYDFGVRVSLIARGPGIRGGRVVDDFTTLMDLAPTFLDLAGVKHPAGMNAHSLLPVLQSEKSGQIDPARTSVITGRERHVGNAREDNKPYPQRGLRTKDFLYIRNFAPERWPLGSPYAAAATPLPPLAELEDNTRLAFPDMDAGPTKAWLIHQRENSQWKRQYDYAFGKRPAEELFDLRTDPDQMTNVAADPQYAATRAALSMQLMETLTAAGDPRVVGDGQTFERSPFSDPEPENRGKKKAR